MNKCEHVEETNRHDRYYWLPDGTELGYLCEFCVIEYGFCGICGRHGEDGFEDGVCPTCYQDAIGKDDQPAPTDTLTALQVENERLRDEITQLEAAIKEAFEQVYESYDSDTPYKDACMSVSDAFAPLGFHLTSGDDDRDICIRDTTRKALGGE